MFAELTLGPVTAAELAKRSDIGDFEVDLEIGTDNKGLFSGVSAVEVKVPSEPNLFYVLKALRDRLDAQAIKGIWWIDTRDMICDAMTKGTLSREPLLALWKSAFLKIIGETPIVFRSTANASHQQQQTTTTTTTF